MEHPPQVEPVRCDGAARGTVDLDLLLARARSGDHDAGVELLRRHEPLIRAVVFRRYRIEREDGDDIVQKVAMRFFRHLPRIGCVSGFLATVSASLCLQHLRNRATERRARETWAAGVGNDRRETRADSADDAIIRRLDAEALLDRAGPRCATLLRETILAGRTQSEYARESGMPLGSVGPTVARCLEKVRRLLREPVRAGRPAD